MRTVCNLNMCNGCMACIDKCPKSCIHIEDTLDKYNAIIDEEKCINCKICKKICPNVNKVRKCYPLEWYQGWSSIDKIRQSSTSGGIASNIIKKFIEDGGYVASCLFDNPEFKFILTNDLNSAKKFAGSKYVKSNPHGIYQEIECILKNDKVLFIGLPCQVAALKNAISTNAQNLYTIDLICHGTPSPRLLKKYIEENDYNYNLINDIKFRDKNNYGLIIDAKKINQSRILDEYTCSFLESINFTENCYSCNYASIDRVSDITLGDSWGSKLKEEENKGISLILIQTNKGKKLIENMELNLKQVDLENAISHNHQLSHPSLLTNSRIKFFKAIKNGKNYKVATFISIPKIIFKQKLKKVLMKLNIIK